MVADSMLIMDYTNNKIYYYSHVCSVCVMKQPLAAAISLCRWSTI